MSDVRFENQGQEFGRPPVESGFDITGKLVSWGLVSSRAEAQYVMIGIIVLAFAGAAFFFFSLGGSGAPPPPPPNMAPAASYQ
jgi:hypothetical protein